MPNVILLKKVSLTESDAVQCEYCGYIQSLQVVEQMVCDPFCPRCGAKFKDDPESYRYVKIGGDEDEPRKNVRHRQ